MTRVLLNAILLTMLSEAATAETWVCDYEYNSVDSKATFVRDDQAFVSPGSFGRYTIIVETQQDIHFYSSPGQAAYLFVVALNKTHRKFAMGQINPLSKKPMTAPIKGSCEIYD